MMRDFHFTERAEIRSHQDLVQLVNRLNRESVTVYRRLSPPLLIGMVKVACEQSARSRESLDPFAPVQFSVSCGGTGSYGETHVQVQTD